MFRCEKCLDGIPVEQHEQHLVSSGSYEPNHLLCDSCLNSPQFESGFNCEVCIEDVIGFAHIPFKEKSIRVCDSCLREEDWEAKVKDEV